MAPSAISSSLLTNAFSDSKDISKLVQNFDFSKIAIIDATNDDYLLCDLAPSYGPSLTDALKNMDDMKQNVLRCMMQNEALESDGQEVGRADQLIKNSSKDFKIDGSPDSSIVTEMHSWFVKLVNDDDVLNNTKINIDVLGKIVAQTGATADSFEAFFSKHEYHEKKVMDIGVLRFPDISHPYFKPSRIQLKAWVDSRRVSFHSDDKNGITGDYNCRKIKPRKELLNMMTSTAKGRAVAALNDINFDS